MQAEATQTLVAPPESGVGRTRLESIDILRGLVIVIMALDHTRDYFSSSAGIFEPTDLTRTYPALFFTRWITHFCAPVFVFLAGVGSYLMGQRRGSAELARFLVTRGLWLAALEVLIVSPLGWSFQLDFSMIRLQVIWAIGVSMILLAGLVRFPARVAGWAGLILMAGHNLLDGSPNGWVKLLHSISFHQWAEGHRIASLYPLIPWVGVLWAGYGAGAIWQWESERRKRYLRRVGASALMLFLALRAFNFYGDPALWKPQGSAFLSVLSFLNVSKYPPSLLYLLLTLGGSALILAWIEGKQWSGLHFFRSFGRTPLFFYLLHLPLIHGAAVVMSWLRSGEAGWLFQDPFFLRRPPNAAPAGYGLELIGVYLVWFAVVVLLYWPCRAYGEFKQKRQHWIWSYL